MESILIATDFTPAARSAEKYAVELAKALGCGVNLLSVYSQAPVAVSHSLTSVGVLNKDRITRQLLEEEAGALDIEELSALTLLAREGARTDKIIEAADQMGAGLIVTGMKSSGKATRRVFGSTITGLMHRSHLPILVIPEGFMYSAPAVIAMGNDFMNGRRMSAPGFLHRMVDVFGPKRFVYKHLAMGNVTQGLNDFIEEHGIELFVMEPQYKTALARWFIKSHSMDMLFKIKIPLLILPWG